MSNKHAFNRVAHVSGLLTTATDRGIPINSHVIAAIPERLDGARVAAMWNDTLAENERLQADNDALREALQMFLQADMFESSGTNLKVYQIGWQDGDIGRVAMSKAHAALNRSI